MTELRRELRQRDLVAVIINAVIGAGIFGISGKVFALTGVWSLAAFFACGCFAALVALCFAEVGSRFRDTGGPYLYAQKAFGPHAAFQVGSLMWLARVSAFAANANLLLSYMASLGLHAESGLSRTVFLSAMILLLALVNILGIRTAAIVNHLFTFGKLVPLVVFIAIGAFVIDPSRLVLHAPPAAMNFSTAVLLLVYAFTGFEMATVPGGEMKNPEHALPRALLTAVGIIALVYAALQAVCIGTLPGLASSTRPVADASLRFLGPAGTVLIVSGIVVSILGNLHITVLSASRIPFAMAENGQLPKWFAHTHKRFQSPDFSIVFTCAFILLMTLGATFLGAVSISTVARLIVYMSTCAALPWLRRKGPPADFQLAAGTWFAVLALAISLWLLAHAPFAEWKAVLVVALVAAGYQMFRRITAS